MAFLANMIRRNAGFNLKTSSALDTWMAATQTSLQELQTQMALIINDLQEVQALFDAHIILTTDSVHGAADSTNTITIDYAGSEAIDDPSATLPSK